MKAIYDVVEKYAGQYVLCVEGSVQVKENGNYCVIGEKDGKPVTMLQAVKDVGSQGRSHPEYWDLFSLRRTAGSRS